MKGIYSLNGKIAARISRNGKTVHLGTFDTEEEAGQIYDVACLIQGKPMNSFNFPLREITVAEIQKVLSILREKGLLTDEDAVTITNRWDVISQLAEKLAEVAEYERQET